MSPWKCATDGYGATKWVSQGRHQHPDQDLNVDWAKGARASTVDAGELVTGEHSGLANLIPGNPGTIDPPWHRRSRASPATRRHAVRRHAGTTRVTATRRTARRSPRRSTIVDDERRAPSEVEAVVGRRSATRRATRSTAAARRPARGRCSSTISQPSPAFSDEGAGDDHVHATEARAGTAATPPSVERRERSTRTGRTRRSPPRSKARASDYVGDRRLEALPGDADRARPDRRIRPARRCVDGRARADPALPDERLLQRRHTDSSCSTSTTTSTCRPNWAGRACNTRSHDLLQRAPASVGSDFVERRSRS